MVCKPSSLSGQVGNEPLSHGSSGCWLLTFVKGNTKDYFIYKLHIGSIEYLHFLKEAALVGERSSAHTCAQEHACTRTHVREKSRNCGLSLPFTRRCANTSQALATYFPNSAVG